MKKQSWKKKLAICANILLFSTANSLFIILMKDFFQQVVIDENVLESIDYMLSVCIWLYLI